MTSVHPDLSWARVPTLKLGSPQQVVGENHYQDALESVAGGQNGSGTRIRLFTATLVREPDNRYDGNAVRVCAGDRTLGYVPRDYTDRFGRAVDRLARKGEAATCRAELTGGWDRGDGDKGAIGVLLHTGSQPTVWSDKVAFLPRSPWHDEIRMVPLAVLPTENQPPDKAVVTLVPVQGGLAVRHGETWVGHVVGRPDVVTFVERIAALGLPTTAEFRPLQDGSVIRLADPDVVADSLHRHGSHGLKTIRRTVEPTGRWICTRCNRVWADSRTPPAGWYDGAFDEDESPHVCPSCWSYAFTHPY